MNYTFGNDPELILRDQKTREPLSAIPILEHSKHNPIILGEGREFYYDNVLAEFSVVPANNKQEAVNSLGKSLAGIKDYLKAKHGNKYEVAAQASFIFPEKDLQHEDAMRFGCCPEYDAWKLQICTPPEPESGLRSAGGHAHLGRSDYKSFGDNTDGVFLLDDWSKVHTIRAMDIFVGLSMAIIDLDPTSAARKKLYGRSSRHRATPYGVEYRTPSNYWIGSPDLVGLVYDLSTYTLTQVEKFGNLDPLIEKLGQENIIKAVDTNDKDLAATLLSKSGLPDELLKAVFSRANKKYNSLYQEWGLA